MNLRALQTLVAIHETQSFMEAAKRLGYNQSAVSMQIKTLEQDLGVTLFDRSVRPPSMTPAALAMIAPAREIIALVHTVREAARNPRSLTGTLALGVIPTAAASILPDALMQLTRRYPNMDITVESGLSLGLTERVQAGTLDAALITESDTIPEELISEVILYERLVVISGSPIEAGSLSKLLTSRPFIRFSRRIGVGVVIERCLQSLDVFPEGSMELDSVEAIVAMVERNLGVSIVPEGAIADGQRRRVFTSALDLPEAVRKISLVYPRGSEKATLLSAVRESLTSATMPSGPGLPRPARR